MSEAINQRNDLVEAITHEVLAALGHGGQAGGAPRIPAPPASAAAPPSAR